MEADVQVETPPTITPDSEDNGKPNARFHAVLVVEGSRTSDGREFAPNSLRWRTLPLPLMWQRESGDRHEGSVVVGRIERIERRGAEIHGWGTFDLGSDNGREAQRLVSEQIMRGISIDAELLEIDREQLMGAEDGKVVLYVEEARIGAATIVSFPAFPQAVIALDSADIPASTDDGRGEAKTYNRDQDIAICAEECGDDDDCMKDCMESKAHMSHDDAEPFAVSNSPWSGSSSRFTDAEWRRATAGCRESGSGTPPKSSCFLPHHEPGGAVSRAGVHAAAARFNQTEAPSAAKTRARSHLASHYRRDLKEDVPKILMQLALVAHADSPGPPADWFRDPELKGPTPLTIARNGRVYGHAALWDACHTGYKECMRPPRSRTNYAHFLTGSVFPTNCDCDGALATGPLVMSTSHADPYAPDSAARRHYDNTGMAVADVTVGEDSFGIWIAGALRPGVTEAQTRALRGSALSGDWRYIGGNLELISLLAVNTPGFPIPRVAAAIDSGITVSLTAAGIAEENLPEPDTTTNADPAELIEELKREQQTTDTDASDDDTTTDDATQDNGDEVPNQEPTNDSPPPEPPPSSGLAAAELLAQLRTNA